MSRANQRGNQNKSKGGKKRWKSKAKRCKKNLSKGRFPKESFQRKGQESDSSDRAFCRASEKSSLNLFCHLLRNFETTFETKLHSTFFDLGGEFVQHDVFAGDVLELGTKFL